MQAIETGRVGRYFHEEANSVPVNFMSNLDVTGGNSGSATLNSRGELVGLLFDGTYEGIIADWDYSPQRTRAIHVSTSYMLWVMDVVDGADHLLVEMGVQPEL